MNRVSARMIFLLILLIASLGLNAGSVLFLLQNVTDDTRIVNSVGYMRGSIQRIVNLELNGINSDSIIRKVDDLSDSFFKKNFQISLFKSEQANFIQTQLTLRVEWHELKGLLTDYRKTKSVDIKNSIIKKSEVLWNSADLSAQEAVNLSSKNLKYFYILILIIFVNLLLAAVIFLYTKNLVRDRLEYQAHHDPLTGILNRRAFEEVLEKEMELSSRYNRPLFLMMLDLDFFKSVNDRYGHDAGDSVLKLVAATIRSNIRKSDSFARIGGEEFVILHPQNGVEKAAEFAEKIRKLIENLKPKKGNATTVSIGLTRYLAGETTEAFLKKADSALYRAKKNGRNRVEIEFEQ